MIPTEMFYTTDIFIIILTIIFIYSLIKILFLIIVYKIAKKLIRKANIEAIQESKSVEDYNSLILIIKCAVKEAHYEIEKEKRQKIS